VVTTTPEEDVPGVIRNLKGWAESPSRLHISWDPPLTPNGVIQRYTVHYQQVLSIPGALDFGSSSFYEDEQEEYEDELDFEEDYYVPPTGPIQEITSNVPEAILEDLKPFTEYFVWIVPVNQVINCARLRLAQSAAPSRSVSISIQSPQGFIWKLKLSFL